MRPVMLRRGGFSRPGRLMRGVAGAVLVLAACGTSDRPISDDSSSTAATTVLSVPSSSVVSPDDTSGGPVCEDELLPGLAALDRTTGEVQWTYCSADLAWREVRGATDDIVYVDATMPDPSASASEYRQLSAVIAIDATSGAELWQVPVARPQLGWAPGPFAGGEVVVVEVDDGDDAAIVGLDARTGDQLWRVAKSDLGGSTDSMSMVAPLANTEEGVVITAPSGLIGLDRTSGEQVWSSDVFLLDESGVMASRGPAAVDGSTVMIPAASEITDAPMLPGGESATGCCVAPDGTSFCFGPDEDSLDSAAASAGDDPPCELVTAPLGPSTLVAVDGSTGATLWQGPRLDHPTAADGYVVGYDHSWMGSSSTPKWEVIVVDGAAGELLWSGPGSESYGDLWAIGDGIVAVTVNDRTEIVGYELDTGGERWRIDAAGLGQPQLISDTTLVLLWEGALSAVSTSDGSILWTADEPVGSPLMNNVGVRGSLLFVTLNSRPWGD